MRLPACSRIFALLLMAVSLGLVPAASAQSVTLGRGLEQLVQMYEWSNPKLPEVMEHQLVSPMGDPLVEIHLQPGVTPERVLPLLQMVGFQLQAISQMDPSLMEGYLPLASARSAARVLGVRHLSAVPRPHTFATPVGSVPSEAVPAEKADKAQDRGLDGTGVRIGVLSDSFDSYGHQVDAHGNPLPAIHPDAADDEATGDLPPTVTVLKDITGGTDEGRAMLQLVHKIAPAAQLGFATADLGKVDFSNRILDLRNIFHADVITDDVVYPDEPMYSDGLLAQTIDHVVKVGAAYFSSAGNNGLEAFEDIYRPISVHAAEHRVSEGRENVNIQQLLAGLAAQGIPVPQSFHTFVNADGSTSITQKFSSFLFNELSFQWDEPFFLNGVKTNFDVYIFDSKGNWLDPNTSPTTFNTFEDNIAIDEPVEILEFIPTGPVPGNLNEGDYQIMIGNVNNGPARHIKYIAINTLSVSERQNAPSVFGHTAARNGQSVGAQFWGITKFPEDFSSPGPVTIYLDDKGNRLHVPEIRQVPQIVGIDGVSTTLPPSSELNPFFGTSAAAPDVAAVAGLVIQAHGGPGSIKPADVYAKLQATASAIPLSLIRNLSGTFAGPVVGAANGEFVRFNQYFSLGVLPSFRSVKSVSLNATGAGLVFNPITSPPSQARFQIGTTHGIDASDITASYSADAETLILNFKPGTFRTGSFFTFGASVFDPTLGATQEDGDRMEGMKMTVTLDNGSTSSSTFFVAPKTAFNRFTGSGLVNADAATQNRKKK